MKRSTSIKVKGKAANKLSKAAAEKRVQRQAIRASGVKNLTKLKQVGY